MNEQVMNVLSKKWVIPTAVGVASFGSGLVAGYIWGKRNGDVFEVNLEDFVNETVDPNQLEIDFDGESEFDHIMQTVEYRVATPHLVDAKTYFASDPEDEYDIESEIEAEEALEEDELEDALAEQNHQNLITDDGDNLPEIRNIFDNDDEWDYESERSTRHADQPYVISVDEFVADEAGCDQSTVTYYAGDDIMANEHDIPLYDYNSMMGELKFGHGSNDPTVVYIRNEKLNMEWEVLLHQGRFDIEVLGHDIEDAYAQRELKHSVPRFRDE